MNQTPPILSRPSRRSLRTLLPRASKKIWRVVTGRTHTIGGGHTDSARYCYAVWLRHLVSLSQNRDAAQWTRVLELGPGRTIGVGLAALLSGASDYFAIDVVDYSNPAQDKRILDELVALFTNRAPIPDHTEFADMFPPLADYRFPTRLISDDVLRQALHPERIARIAGAIAGEHAGDVSILRATRWDDPRIPAGGIDLLLSQAVMLYVTDLDAAYAQIASWLAPGGVMTQTYNFTSVGKTPQWNGHWAANQAEWAAIEGAQPYHMSRLPYSAHPEALRRAGLLVAGAKIEERSGGITRARLAPEFAHLTDQDLVAARALIQAERPRTAC
jgi:hypothetical protein